MAEVGHITLHLNLVGSWLLVALRAEFSLLAEIWAAGERARQETARDFAAARARLLGTAGLAPVEAPSTLLDVDDLGQHVVQFASDADEIHALRAELARLARGGAQS